MSILIKGMEMPKSCDECRIMVFEDTNCVPEMFCGCPIVFKAHPQGVGHRPDYCPLIEIQDKCGKWSDKQKAYRGEYGDVHFGYQCSVCGAIVNKTNYCGACGAKMENENVDAQITK